MARLTAPRRDDGVAAAATAAGRRRWRPSAPALALVGVLVAGAGLRLWFLRSQIGSLDGDEAVTGAMAQRIVDGELYVWFAGQRYMGAFEQYLQAATLAVLPDNATTLRLPQVALGLATALVCYAVARTAARSAWVGVVAAALFLFGPVTSLTWTTRSRGAYAVATFVAMLGVLAALRTGMSGPGVGPGVRPAFVSSKLTGEVVLADTSVTTAPPDPPAMAHGWVWPLVLGGCCGLGVWANPTAGWLLVPAVLWAVGTVGRRGALPAAVPFAIGLVVGALPLIADTIRNGWPEFSAPVAAAVSFAQRSENVISDVPPVFVGARIAGGWLVDWLPLGFVVVGALMALGAALWQRRRGLLALVTLRSEDRHPVDVLLLAFPLALFVYAVSRSGNFTEDTRYVTTLYPAVAVLVAVGAARLGRRGGAVLVTSVLMWSLAGVFVSERRTVDGLEFSASVSAVGVPDVDIAADAVDVLIDRGEQAVWAEYWLAYPMRFMAGDRLDVGPIGYSRLHDETDRVRAATRVAYAAQFGAPADMLRAQLAAAGITWTEIEVGDGPSRIYLFVDLSRVVRPFEIGLPEVG